MSEPKLQLKIDLRSGKIEPELPAEGARDATTLAVMDEINAELPELEAKVGLEPRPVLLRAYVLKEVLEAHPRNWINDRSKRREWNETEERVGKLKAAAIEAMPEGEGDWVWGELPYVRETLTLLHNKQKAENEVNHLILTPLGNLEHAEINYKRMGADDLARVCQEVSEVLRRTAELDDEVLSWGPKNRGALLHGRELVEIPAGMLPTTGAAYGGFAAGVVLIAIGGALLAGVVPGVPKAAGLVGLIGLGPIAWGVGQLKQAGARRAAIPEEFSELSGKFRERLYLICALRELQVFRSRYSKAFEAFRTPLPREGGQPRWKKAKFDGRDITELFATESWDPRATVEMWLAEKVKEEFRLESTKLAGPEDLDAEAWGVIQQAFELESIDTGHVTEAQLLDSVSNLLFSRRGEDTKAERQRVFAQVKQAWEASELKERGGND